MTNGSDDFSALNMQGDMSKRKTSSSKNNPSRDDAVETNNTNILYAILALFIFEIAVDSVREIMLIAILFSFIIYGILTGKAVTVFSHFLSNLNLCYL